MRPLCIESHVMGGILFPSPARRSPYVSHIRRHVIVHPEPLIES